MNEPDPQTMTALGTLFFTVFTVVLFVIGPIHLSRHGGWHELAGKYGTSATCRGKRLWCRPVLVGLVRYEWVVVLGSDTTGLYVSMVLPLRVAHPPLFFPWDDISTRRIRGFVGDWIDLSFARCPGRGIAIPIRAASRLFRAGGRSTDGWDELTTD